jgi:hypothetical protein
MPTQGLKSSPMAEGMELDWFTISRAVSPRGCHRFVHLAPHNHSFRRGQPAHVGNVVLAERIRAAREDAQRFSDGAARVKRDFDVFLQKLWPHVTQK